MKNNDSCCTIKKSYISTRRGTLISGDERLNALLCILFQCPRSLAYFVCILHTVLCNVQLLKLHTCAVTVARGPVKEGFAVRSVHLPKSGGGCSLNVFSPCIRIVRYVMQR